MLKAIKACYITITPYIYIGLVPIFIFEDNNNGAKILSNNPEYYKRTRYININIAYYLIKEAIFNNNYNNYIISPFYKIK